MARLEGFIEKFDQDQVIIVQADGTVEAVAKNLVPGSAQEGDFVSQTAENGLFKIDYETTEKRRREIRRLADNCFD